jgi:carbonic anhydrase
MSIQTLLSRRDFLRVGGVVVLAATTAACAPAPAAQTTAQSEGPVDSADQALQRLMDGNKRYVANKSIDLNESESRRVEVAAGQKPFATIFSCIDSRVPPELVFDRGLGDLFVIRTAGQVVDSAVLGSLEFTVAEVHVPLVMVLGHENCGAVKATVETVAANVKAEAEINYLVEGIRPAVEKVHGQSGDEIDNVVRANVELVVDRLKESPILSEAIEKSALKIVGARYDLNTGAVELIA